MSQPKPSPADNMRPAHPRIKLSQQASDHLSQTGQPCFAVVAFDRSDERSGRWIVHLIPSTYARADAAIRVAKGITKESKPRPKATIESTEAA